MTPAALSAPADRQATDLPASGDALTSAGMSDFALALRPEPGPALPAATPTAAPDPGWPARVLDLALANPSITGGLAVAAVLAVALLISWRRGKVEGWIVVVSWIAAFGFSAEGMWYVATDKADVPPVVAAGVFFVFELFQIRSMLAARRKYVATTVRDAAGRVVKAGDPGGHGLAVWAIAGVMGLIVALAAGNPADALLRVSIPLGVALLWWNDLTEDGVVRDRPRSSWRWTPRRLLLWLGAIEPGERDIEQVHRAARVKQMTDLEFERLTATSERRRARVTSKLARLSLSADDAMIAEARANVARSGWFTDPGPGVRLAADPGHPPTFTPGEAPVSDPGGPPVEPPGVGAGFDPGDTPGVEAGDIPGPDGGGAPGTSRAATRAPARSRPPSPKKLKALKLRERHPEMAAAEIARKVPADYKTVREWLKDASAVAAPVAEPAVPVTAGVNGHDLHPSTPDEGDPS